MRFFSTVVLVNAPELEKATGRQAQIANRLMHVDLVILEELGYLPFSRTGSALVFRLLAKPYECTSVVITTKFSFGEWGNVFVDAKMTAALLDGLTRETQTQHEAERRQATPNHRLVHTGIEGYATIGWVKFR